MTNYMGTTLYTGVTNDIARRLLEHRESKGSAFAARYKVTRLIYVEETNDVRAAIEREKQIKGWSHKKKFELAATLNPRWEVFQTAGLTARKLVKRDKIPRPSE
jgi:putative endonuclease